MRGKENEVMRSEAKTKKNEPGVLNEMNEMRMGNVRQGKGKR